MAKVEQAYIEEMMGVDDETPKMHVDINSRDLDSVPGWSIGSTVDISIQARVKSLNESHDGSVSACLEVESCNEE